jgi:hypothetical protein
MGSARVVLRLNCRPDRVLREPLLLGGAQALLESEHARSPLTVLYHISPASAFACIPVFLVIELRPFLRSSFAHSDELIFEALGIVFGGGLISFLLIMAEVRRSPGVSPGQDMWLSWVEGGLKMAVS